MSAAEDIVTYRRAIRWLLIVLGAIQVPVGGWILIAPHSFYTEFPGFGRHWVSPLGPYDEHLLRDFGAGLLGLSVLLVLAGVVMHRRTVQIALVAWLFYAVPHLLFHVLNTQPLTAGDNMANLLTLGTTVLVPAGLLVLTRRREPGTAETSASAAAASASSPAPAPADVSAAVTTGPRIAGVRERGSGPLVRYAYRTSRKQTGKVVDPIAVTAHHPMILAGYGALELALDRSHRVDRRLKALAELKAATLTGCEFCIDIGSKLGRDSGVSERQLREFLVYRASDAFSPLERLVIDYAAGMSKTPVEVPDALFAALRENFDEAQIVELTAAIALENYRGRFNWALGIGSQGFADGQVRVEAEVAGTAA
jgi:AhpD family alkylhydroperoxidase